MYHIAFLLPLLFGSSTLTVMLQYLSPEIQAHGQFYERLIYNVIHALLGIMSLATLYATATVLYATLS